MIDGGLLEDYEDPWGTGFMDADRFLQILFQEFSQAASDD